MKYLIWSENLICKHQASLLTKELERFDVRSEIIFTNSSKTGLGKELFRSDPDLFIVFGSKKSNSIVKRANKLKIKTCFFYQSLLDGQLLGSNLLNACKIYVDLPAPDDQMGFEYSGSLLYEYIRKNESYSDQETSEILISIFVSGTRDMKMAEKMRVKFQRLLPEYNFIVVDVSKNFTDAIRMAVRSNAIVAMDQLSSMFSVLTNCPSVLINKKLFFKERLKNQSIVNELLGREAISVFTQDKSVNITEEISRILLDHQYCAEIMSSFQELKLIIGMEPVARQTAQKMVDWLEEANET
ncbi:hypothetical protein [Ekhidna sp.]